MDDVNELIYLAHQMGILDRPNQILSNASKCLTRSAVEATYISQTQNTVLEVKDIYGMFFILIIGFAGALLIFIAECTIFKIYTQTRPLKGERSQRGREGHEAETKKKGARGKANVKNSKTNTGSVENWAELASQ